MAHSMEYLEEALAAAKAHLPGWQWAVIHSAAMPRAGGRSNARASEPSEIERIALSTFSEKACAQLGDDDVKAAWSKLAEWHASAVKRKQPAEHLLRAALCMLADMTARGMEPEQSPLRDALDEFSKGSGVAKSEITPNGRVHVETQGPDGATVAFFAASPNQLEKARQEILTGAVSQIFKDLYLAPLGLTRQNVIVSCVVPRVLKGGDDKPRDPTSYEVAEWSGWVAKELERTKPRVVVALGQTAKRALGDRAHFVLPHPAVYLHREDASEVGRKIKKIAKAMEQPQDEAPAHEVAIAKADAEKQIVYGVVLDPYQIDAHGDWIPTAEIEKTAHAWMRNSRVVGLQHRGQAHARVVESWVVHYPSDADYRKALRNEPHRAFEMPYGEDKIHSGAWLLGVELGPAEWAAHKEGKINAFSIGGTGTRAPMSMAEMPSVEFLPMFSG